MRAPAVSFAKRFAAAALAALLTFTLLPAGALAEGEGDSPSVERPQEDNSVQAEEAAGASASGGTEPATAMSAPLASALTSAPTAFVNADVALDGEPVIGSFTVDGLTFVVAEGSDVELVGAAGAEALPLMLPESVAYNDVDYVVTSIGAYAFYLSGITSVELPASVNEVDDRAFRSSDVASVQVAEGNPNYSSFDGALYDADQLSLLLIPEGKQGTVRIPKTAEVSEASVFSHCPLVDAVSVDAGSAAFASENGLLYTSDLTTLLRVPAGATEITIREGCTIITAGALEACAKLTTINAPSTVTSISPDVFRAIPTVSLPVVSAILSEGSEAAEAEESNEDQASEAGGQLIAMVALSSDKGDIPDVQPTVIRVAISSEADQELWRAIGFELFEEKTTASIVQSGSPRVAAIDYGVRVRLPYHVLGLRDGGADTGEFNEILYGDYSVNGGDSMALYQDDVYGAYGVINDDRYVGICTETGGRLRVEAFFEVGSFHYADGGIYVTGYEAVGVSYPFTVILESGDATNPGTEQVGAAYDDYLPDIEVPVRPGYAFEGYWHDGNIAPSEPRVMFYDAEGQARHKWNIASDGTLYAKWRPIDIDISFETSSKPHDEDALGEVLPNETIVSDEIESGARIWLPNPERPGYIFQGWIPSSNDGYALPNEKYLVGKEWDSALNDGKGGWRYWVNASDLPQFADSPGKVNLAARWTAAVKVDAPLSATFYYDLTQPSGEGHWNEPRDAAVKGAAEATGAAAIRNHSAVPLRVAGMESTITGETPRLLKYQNMWLNNLGSGGPGALSVFPTTNEATGTEKSAHGPSSVSQDKGDDLAHMVTLALDDIKHEWEFDANAWAIEAATVGDDGIVVKTGDMRLGYRLNLGEETGITLDYDALVKATEGKEEKPATLTDITYSFALEAPFPTGTKSDPLYVEVSDPEVGSVGIYGLSDIKAAANDFSTRVDPATNPDDWDSIKLQIAGSPYAKLYTELLEGDANFKLKVGGAYIDMRLLGIAQDTRSDNGKRAGLTFEAKDAWAHGTDGSNGTFDCRMRADNGNDGGWAASDMYKEIRSVFMNALDAKVRWNIVSLVKYQQMPGSTPAACLGRTAGETVWLPSLYEVYGVPISSHNESEALANVSGYTPFQYQAYKNGRQVAKSYDGATVYWWLRSASRDSTNRFCSVRFTGGGSYARYALGVAPCFSL